MKIFVCIKQVPDTETRIKLKADGSGIDESGIKWVISPYDEFAIEEALKIKEARGGTPQVVALSVGPKARTVEALRTALAMGADEAGVVDAASDMDPFQTAQALAAVIQKEGGAQLVLTGKLAIDDNAASVSQYLAERLGVPHCTVVGKLVVEDGQFTAEREVEGGTKEVFVLRGPAVIAANKGLNTPRYASLPGIMKAKKKTIKEFSLGDLGLGQLKPRLRYQQFRLPPEKPPVKMISGDPAQQAKDLARLLMDEAKVF